MNKFNYDNRPCGAGKTYEQIDRIVNTPGLYMLASDRREGILERENDIRKRALAVGVNLHVGKIASARDAAETYNADEGSRNVRADIEALPHIYRSGHVVMLITHEGLKSADLSNFGGWELIIDETPSVIDRQTLDSRATADFFAARYDLEPITSTASLVALKPGLRLTNATVARDVMARAVSTFHARVASRRIDVVAEIKAWSDIEKAPWSWWSIWSPEQLQAFDRVTVLANAFHRSATYALFNARWPEIMWHDLNLPCTRQFAPRPLTIGYFVEAHTASHALFKEPRGQSHLRMISAELCRRIGKHPHIWTCNAVNKGHLNDIPANI